MTFKHIDFDSSPTMRSLARLATEKGWAKDEPIQKTAAPQLDLNPSDDFTDNLMKLCSGLRRSGFEKQADELEDKFIQYKRANALYNISGEEGEDLVHAAHPKGSHKMENIDSSEATFEDILDKHLKTLNVVNKKPTGKLASRDLIAAVGKVVLGAGPLDDLYAQSKDALEKFQSVYSSIAAAMGEEATSNASFFNMISGILDRRDANKNKRMNDDFSDILLKAMDSLKGAVEPSYFNLPWEHSAFSPQQQQAWQNVEKFFPTLKKYADRFKLAVSKIEDIEGAAQKTQEQKEIAEIDPENKAQEPATSSAVPNVSEQLIQAYTDAKSYINRVYAYIRSNRLSNAAEINNFLKSINNYIDAERKEFDEYGEQKSIAAPAFMSRFNSNVKPGIDALKAKWGNLQ